MLPIGGEIKVNKEDLIAAAKLSLPIEWRRQPFEVGVIDFQQINELIEKNNNVNIERFVI